MKGYKVVKRLGPSESHPLYLTWTSMKTRCYNPNHEAFKHCGGKGVYVCERWLHDFWAFAEDMGHRPAGHTLDRIHGHLGYSPENCRWADKKTQAMNRSDWSTKTLVNIRGVLIGIRDAADYLGVPYTSAYREYRKNSNLDKYL